MHVFIDDSGDTGFKFERASSTNFVIACCVFTGSDSMEKTANALRQRIFDLGMNPSLELKFSKLDMLRRIEFLSVLSSQDFYVRAIHFDKTIMRSKYLDSNPMDFSNYAIRQVLTQSAGTIQDAKVRIDGDASARYKRSTSNYLKEQTNNHMRVIKDVKYIDSRRSMLIQSADLVAGAIRRAFVNSSRRDPVYLEQIGRIMRRQESDLWHFK